MQDGQVYCNRGGWLGRKIVLQYSLLVKNCIAGEGLNGWFCVAIQKLYCGRAAGYCIVLQYMEVKQIVLQLREQYGEQ